MFSGFYFTANGPFGLNHVNEFLNGCAASSRSIKSLHHLFFFSVYRKGLVSFYILLPPCEIKNLHNSPAIKCFIPELSRRDKINFNPYMAQ